MRDDLLMRRLVLALGKRQRLWPPDDAVSVASLGLLGWARSAYIPPEQALDELAALLWLGGLEGLRGAGGGGGRHQRHNSPAMQAGDQAAIECYAGAVASAIFGFEAQRPRGNSDFPEESEWTHDELSGLLRQGVAHGQSMRTLLLDFSGRFRRAGGGACGMGDAQERAHNHEPHSHEPDIEGTRADPSQGGGGSLVAGLLDELTGGIGAGAPVGWPFVAVQELGRAQTIVRMGSKRFA